MSDQKDQKAAEFYARIRAWKRLEFEEQAHVRALVRKGLLRLERIDGVTIVSLPSRND